MGDEEGFLLSSAVSRPQAGSIATLVASGPNLPFHRRARNIPTSRCKRDTTTEPTWGTSTSALLLHAVICTEILALETHTAPRIALDKIQQCHLVPILVCESSERSENS